jgi:hypothetical protein
MGAGDGKKTNPMGMRPIEAGGPFVLPPTLCSKRRVEFFKRGNTILGFYSAIGLAARIAQDVFDQWDKEGKFKPETPFRATMRPGGEMSQMNYGLLRKHFSKSGIHLTNQVFLMLYGSLEAYIADMVLDALTQNGHADPYEETLRLMYTSKWFGKIDRIGKKLDVGLGGRVFLDKFRDIDMGFLGEECKNPIDFLEKSADLRHRLVHSGGRVDKEFALMYPRAGLAAGQSISLPFGFPISFQLFLAQLTEAIDEAFSARFDWQRTSVSPERLTE